MNPFNLPVAPNFTRKEIADACRKWGPHVRLLPGTIDGAKLLWALAGNESSFGADCKPRHEAIYCTGGKYAGKPQVVSLTAKFGHSAHSSFGPWQMLLLNCANGITPQEMFDLDTAAFITTTFITSRILQFEKATTLNQIADAYNSGDWRDRDVPEKYIIDCAFNYSVPMPV